MSNLTRWDPVREMLSMRRAMDRMFDNELFNEDWNQTMNWNLPLDVSELEDGYVVKASLPGVNPDDLEITYNNAMLTIRANVKAEEEKKGETYHMRERRYGTFSRSISLPSSIQADAIDASYDAGVLTLRLPKSEEVKPRKIQIQSGRSQKQPVIEGK
jgi:HSP20 family protein